MKEEYNEVYGWMPRSVVNNLSPADRGIMFLHWLNRKPTDTGWFIVATVVTTLGEDFLEYVFKVVIDGFEENGDPYTKDEVVDLVTGLFESFASDANILYGFVDTYREEMGLKIPDVDQEVDQQKSEEKKSPARDAKGRFVKKRSRL